METETDLDIYALLVRPDGTVDRLTAPMKTPEGVEIFMCPDRVHVGCVGEWSAVDGSPSNHAGWLLYGRSKLYGDVTVWRDDREPLDGSFVETVETLGHLVTLGRVDDAYVEACGLWSDRT